MAPASRTPEGDPLRCEVCGAEQRIEYSNPPGDSVCPVCGAHAWFVEPPVDEIETARRTIRRAVGSWEQMCRDRRPLDEVVNKLATTLRDCTASFGANVWLAGQRRWWSSHLPLELVASDGLRAPREFVVEVITGDGPRQQSERISDETVVLIGSPVRRANRVVGALTLVQRANTSPAARLGNGVLLDAVASTLGNYLPTTALRGRKMARSS